MKRTYQPEPKMQDRLSRAKTKPRAIHGDKANAVPKAFRQYAKRYGAGVEEMVRMQAQIDVPMLDHWRDKREAAHRMIDMLQRLA